MLSRTASRTASSPARTSSAGRRGSAACADQRTDAGRPKWRKASGSRKAMSSAIAAASSVSTMTLWAAKARARRSRGRRRRPAGRSRARGTTRQRIPGASGKRAQEGGHRVAAAVPGRHRRHRDRGLLGEHGGERVDVAALPGRDEARRRSRAGRRRRARAAWPAGCARAAAASTLLWARCSALYTEAGVVSSASATSSPEKPSTSRRMSTARWRAGRCWSAAMKASSTLSRCS